MMRRRTGARSGLAALEFGLLAPVILVLAIGTTEAVGFLRTWFRIEQATAATVSAASRLESINTAAVAGLFEVAKAVAEPYRAWNSIPPDARARTVISVVSNPTTGNQVVAWSCSRGDSTLVARVAGTATLPANFAVPEGQSVLVVEIINATPPWRIMSAAVFLGAVGPTPLRAHAIHRPRSTELVTLSGGCPT